MGSGLVLALDAASSTGWAVFDRTSDSDELLASGVINGQKIKDVQARLWFLFVQLDKLLTKWPNCVTLVMEDNYFGGNVKVVKFLNQVRGAINVMASKHNAAISYMPIRLWKKCFTGDANCEKEDAQARVKQLYNKVVGSDEADAIGIGFTFCAIERDSSIAKAQVKVKKANTKASKTPKTSTRKNAGGSRPGNRARKPRAKISTGPGRRRR